MYIHVYLNKRKYVPVFVCAYVYKCMYIRIGNFYKKMNSNILKSFF